MNYITFSPYFNRNLPFVPFRLLNEQFFSKPFVGCCIYKRFFGEKTGFWFLSFNAYATHTTTGIFTSSSGTVYGDDDDHDDQCELV